MLGCDNSKSGSKSKLKVLIIGFSSTDVQNVLNWAEFMPNYEFNSILGQSIVSGDQLDTNDVVLVFSNSFSNGANVGEVLYNYVDNGGKLLMGTFVSYHEHYNTGFGNMSLLTPVDYSGSHSNQDTLIIKSNHPLYQGVDNLITYYGGGDDSLKNDGDEIGKFTHGNYFAARNKNTNGNVVYVALFPAEPHYRLNNLNASGENNLRNFYRIWANAIRFTHSGTSSADDFDYEQEEQEILTSVRNDQKPVSREKDTSPKATDH